MRGTMMDFPLTLQHVFERNSKIFPRVEIVSRRPDRSIEQTCWGNVYQRARRLSSALIELGMKPGDRVASMMWNHSGHLETFCAVPCAGGILHTLNLRLHAQEIAAIANHAEDRFLIVDDVLLPVLEKFRSSVNFSSTGSNTSSTIRNRSSAWFAIAAISWACSLKFSVCKIPPAQGTAQNVSKCPE